MNPESSMVRSLAGARAGGSSESLRGLISSIRADVYRKRLVNGRSVSPLSLCLGLLSINVIAVALWRFSMYFMGRFNALSLFLYYLNIVIFSFDASPYSSVGPGMVVHHLVGCVLHGKFGKNCTLYGRNLVGGKGKGDLGGWKGGPILGDGITLGFGGAVMCHEAIGDNVTVGAGAWCFKGVAPGVVIVGMPAAVLRRKSDDELKEEAALCVL